MLNSSEFVDACREFDYYDRHLHNAKIRWEVDLFEFDRCFMELLEERKSKIFKILVNNLKNINASD